VKHVTMCSNHMQFSCVVGQQPRSGGVPEIRATMCSTMHSFHV